MTTPPAVPSNKTEDIICRYSIGDCEMLPRANGSYIKVVDVVSRLRDLTDNDHVEWILEKIEKMIGELHD